MEAECHSSCGSSVTAFWGKALLLPSHFLLFLKMSPEGSCSPVTASSLCPIFFLFRVPASSLSDKGQKWGRQDCDAVGEGFPAQVKVRSPRGPSLWQAGNRVTRTGREAGSQTRKQRSFLNFECFPAPPFLTRLSWMCSASLLRLEASLGS